MVFESISLALQAMLDPILLPLIYWPPWIAMGLLTLLISLIITVIYKYTTNQTLMKELRAQMKKSQQKMKKARGNTKKMMEVQREMASTQHKFMMQSFRSLIFTFIPIIILFGWLQAHFAVDPVMPGDSIEVLVKLEAEAQGEVTLQLINQTYVERLTKVKGFFGESNEALFTVPAPQQTSDLVVTYEEEQESFPLIVESRTVQKRQDTFSGAIRAINVEYPGLIIFNLFGIKFNWFWSYIIFSIVFSTSLRKLLKVY